MVIRDYILPGYITDPGIVFGQAFFRNSITRSFINDFSPDFILTEESISCFDKLVFPFKNMVSLR